jgi:hypothetical protein
VCPNNTTFRVRLASVRTPRYRAQVQRNKVRRVAARLTRAGGLHALRRYTEQRADQAWALTRHRLGPSVPTPPFDGDPRLGLVTVNFSTTRLLKLMLCTLGEQSALWFVQHLVIVDNDSRDGGRPFIRALAERAPRVRLVEHQHFLNHARGMRAGIRELDHVGRDDEPASERANLVVFCDTDVVFRNPDALLDLSAAMIFHDAAFGGEARLAPPSPHPDIQASFFAVRRDLIERREVLPLVNHGSPSYWMQASMLRAGLTVLNFPSNHGGYILHRGRSGASAAGEYYERHSYAKVTTTYPHYMGVPDGAAIWAGIEDRWARLLEPDAEPALLDHLAERFAVIGDDVGD